MSTRPAPPPPDTPDTGDPLGVSPPDAEEGQRALMHMPVDVRSVSLAVLAVLACVAALRLAGAVFIPLMLGVMFSYALGPVIDTLERWRIPRSIGTAVLMTAIVAGIGWTGYRLSDDAAAMVESLPDAAQKLRQAITERRHKSAGAIEQVQKAATQLEQAAEENSAAPPASRGVTRVQIERPHFNIRDYFWTGTLGLVALLGQATIVVFITYFLLAAGTTFRRKLVKIAGPTFTQKRITVQALDEITLQIQRYLLVQVFTSLLVGIATTLSFVWLGIEHAGVWGVGAAVLNFIPYIGSIVITGAAAVAAFLQFGTIEMGLAAGGVSLVLHTVSGYLITPWLTSRASRMNAVTVFVGVLAFGWLWGAWGLVLGVPILMMVKAVCDRVDDLKPIGELLGA